MSQPLPRLALREKVAEHLVDEVIQGHPALQRRGLDPSPELGRLLEGQAGGVGHRLQRDDGNRLRRHGPQPNARTAPHMSPRRQPIVPQAPIAS